MHHLVQKVDKVWVSSKLNHNMDEYWQKLKPILIQSYQPNTDKLSEIDAVEKCILEFADIDPDSFAFRYPTNKNGIAPLLGKAHLQNISYINLPHLAEKMAGIYRFLLEADSLLL